MTPDPAHHVSLHPTRLTIDPEAFVAPTAVLRGEVRIGARSSVWYNTVLRGDLAPVILGADTNVQDGAILHVEVDGPAVVGDRVTIGHMALVHGATVEDDCLIAMGAIVLSGARVGRESIIGAGALVKEGWQVPPRSLVVGVPGRVVRPVTDQEIARVRMNWSVYVGYARHHKREEAERRARGGES